VSVPGGTDAGKLLAPAPRAPLQPLSSPPSFSVVIPAYEAAATVGETLASVFAQSPAPREVIVVDDGSRDAIEEALAPYMERIRLIRQPNKGVAAARNAGLRECSGEFVLVVDADDVLLPGRLAALGRLGQERPDLDLLCTDVLFEVEGRREGRFFAQNPFPLEDQRGAIFERCFPIHPAARRSRLEEVGGFDESLRTAEDWDCALRLILSGSLTGLYDEPLELYRIHPGSLSDSRARTFRDRVRMLEKARLNAHLREDERPALERAIASQRYRAALAAAQEALAMEAGDARRRGLELARLRVAPPRERLWGLALFMLPSRGRQVLRRRGTAASQLRRLLPGRRA
jgi:GT2 family glycosyltransferase